MPANVLPRIVCGFAMNAGRAIMKRAALTPGLAKKCMLKKKANSCGIRGWQIFDLCPKQLRIDTTLTNGQCFNWKQYPQSGGERSGEGLYFYGAIGWRVYLLRQTKDLVYFKLLSDGEECAPTAKQVLEDYFQVNTDLNALYKTWRKNDDAKFHAITDAFPGMRILRQDPVECLFSFITSSNNNISRIIQILDRLRAKHGRLLWQDPRNERVACYSFPTLETLSRISIEEYRSIGLGYRAKYFAGASEYLVSKGLNADILSKNAKLSTSTVDDGVGAAYLYSLRQKDRDVVQSALIELPGVGRKVADCVALFSLDQRGCVPVDTHVWHIACRDFDPSLSETKSLTPTVYARVGDLFRARFGDYAGWAHSLLFAAELPAFSHRLPPEVHDAIATSKMEERKRKAALKELKKKRRAEKLEGLESERNIKMK
jgi:N-glycosylase/DNA lyase